MFKNIAKNNLFPWPIIASFFFFFSKGKLEGKLVVK